MIANIAKLHIREMSLRAHLARLSVERDRTLTEAVTLSFLSRDMPESIVLRSEGRIEKVAANLDRLDKKISTAVAVIDDTAREESDLVFSYVLSDNYDNAALEEVYEG